MKKLNLLTKIILSLIILSLVSCNKDTLLSSDNAIVSEVEDNSSASELEHYAKLISQMDITLDMITEVNKEVNNSVKKGYDEDVTFKQLINQVINSKEGTNLFASALLAKLKEERNILNSKNSGSEIEDLMTELEEKGYNIYWPYSDDWDGVSKPVITFAPEKDQDWNYAYPLEEGEDEVILVDEEYAIQNPVWVINNSERIEGIKIYDNTDLTVTESPVPGNINKYVIALNLGEFRSEKNHDSWLWGGSEYVIQAGAPDKFNFESGSNLTILDQNVTAVGVYFTRKEIKNKTKKTLNIPIVSEWKPELQNIAFMIHEHDYGRWTDEEFNLKVIIDGKNYEITGKLPLQKHDDLIYRHTFARNYIFSTINNLGEGKWKEFTSDGVYWTLPYELGEVLIN